jgi:hypothetical protein
MNAFKPVMQSKTNNSLSARLVPAVIKCALLLIGFSVLGCVAKTTVPTITGEALEELPEIRPQYFVSPLPMEEWYDQNVLNYSPGFFTFPPPAGFRIMQYSSRPTTVVIDLFRETLDIDTTFAKVIKRRQGCDHCQFNDEEYQKRRGMDLVQIKADCYRWQSGEFKRKYYFLRDGNLVYTFRMLSAPEEYEEMAPEFDHFVNYTIAQYMQYPAEQDMVPYEHYADQELDPQLLSLFNPARPFVESQ